MEASFLAVKNDIVRLIKRSFRYNMNSFGIDEKSILDKNFELTNVLNSKKMFDENYLNKSYNDLKVIEEKIIKYTLDIKENLSEEKKDIFNNMYTVISNAVYSAKYIKDIKLNIESIQDSDNKFIYKKYDNFKGIIIVLYKNISKIID
ncbi:hypothetical protein EOM09_07275 [bacterium]|nr:hypothetical protein [bacterium]